jgi:hypothetical protein
MKKWFGRCNVEFYNGSWKQMLLDDNLRMKSIQWEWDSNRCGKGIHTFHNNQAAVFHAHTFQPCQVLVKTPCTGKEKYYIEFEVVHSSRGAINVGVSGKHADVENRCGCDNNGWSFSLFSGALFHNQCWAPQTGCSQPLLSKGTRIGMGLDMGRRTITFFINNINYGVVVENLPDYVFPSISLGDVGDCVVIVPPPCIPKF